MFATFYFFSALLERAVERFIKVGSEHVLQSLYHLSHEQRKSVT